MSMRQILPESGTPSKPRMVFFQWDHEPNRVYAKYMLDHARDHIRCLQNYFDVTIVNFDCDYSEICNKYEQDISLFETGYQTNLSRRTKIINVNTNNQVPRVAFYNADSWSDRRAGFLSDIDEWAPECIFSICATTAEYMPSIVEKLYIFPNFIDPDIFKDYGSHKTIPIALTGQRFGLYPWREAVFPILSAAFPCLNCPPFGYADGLAARTLTGESYARAINASFAIPTCGTMAREVVRKHFEIPGAKSCLIAERAPALEAAGFVDGENCVFADPEDVLDVVDSLLSDRGRLKAITEAGYQLVHSRHTLFHRPQILQWLMLRKTLPSGWKIVQPGPFEDLVAVSGEGVLPVAGIPASGLDRRLLAKADAAIRLGEWGEASECFSQCLQYSRELPEARFGLALCSLQSGDADRAASILSELIVTTTVVYGAANPDPVEWAYFIVALICQGRLQEARRLSAWYPDLDHHELSLVRQMLDVFKIGPVDISNSVGPGSKPHSRSVHEVPKRTFDQFAAWLAVILQENGQSALSRSMQNALFEDREGEVTVDFRPIRPRSYSVEILVDAVFRLLRLRAVRPNLPPMEEFRYLDNVGLKLRRLVLGSRFGATIRHVRSARRRRVELAKLRAKPGGQGGG